MAGKLKEKAEEVIKPEVAAEEIAQEDTIVPTEVAEAAPVVLNEGPKEVAQVGHSTRAFRQ